MSTQVMTVGGTGAAGAGAHGEPRAPGLGAAVRSEARALTTTRSLPALAAGTVALVLMVVFGSGAGGTPPGDLALAEQQEWFFTVLLTRLLFVVLGVRLVTDAFRHGTVTPGLLATPSRSRLLAAQVVAAAGAAVFLAVLAQATLLGALAASRGLPPVDDRSWASLAGMLAGAALFAALGVGIGTLLRSQVLATVGAVIWLLLGEDVLRLRLGEAVDYLPGHAGIGLAVQPGGLVSAQLHGAAVLAGWVVAAAVAGAALMRRRDIG